MSIRDKVVVITGASSGIGAATAMMLAKQGAMVMLGARRRQRLEALVRDIEHLGGKASYYQVDVTRFDQVQGLVQAAMDTFGRVDAIFNNAGIMPNSPMSDVRIDEWNAMIDVNLKGVLHGIAAVLPVFKAQKGGHIITTSSVAGLKTMSGPASTGPRNLPSATPWKSSAWSRPKREPVFARRPCFLRPLIRSSSIISAMRLRQSG